MNIKILIWPKKICSILDEKAPENKKDSNITRYEELIEFVQDRPGHDVRYAIDPNKNYNRIRLERYF